MRTARAQDFGCGDSHALTRGSFLNANSARARRVVPGRPPSVRRGVRVPRCARLLALPIISASCNTNPSRSRGTDPAYRIRECTCRSTATWSNCCTHARRPSRWSRARSASADRQRARASDRGGRPARGSSRCRQQHPGREEALQRCAVRRDLVRAEPHLSSNQLVAHVRCKGGKPCERRTGPRGHRRMSVRVRQHGSQRKGDDRVAGVRSYHIVD